MPITSTANVKSDTITTFHIKCAILLVVNQPYLPLLKQALRPIKATIGPIAAGGRTISSHFVPTLPIKSATKVKILNLKLYIHLMLFES